ncbi:uncharacterized protein A4U43_C05F30690 [Asparagus officinalis]|uniref:Uncharacterized protein n=1 Tax=Asparagus officinalis TaxID=4686 RepID=A0A5P1EW51_ASPOF|nr:uncharacterized protein A4U43_C05F30690 [Asparagus officinalis]
MFAGALAALIPRMADDARDGERQNWGLDGGLLVENMNEKQGIPYEISGGRASERIRECVHNAGESECAMLLGPYRMPDLVGELHFGKSRPNPIVAARENKRDGTACKVKARVS